MLQWSRSGRVTHSQLESDLKAKQGIFHTKKDCSV